MNKKKPIYLCSQEAMNLIDISNGTKIANHQLGYQNERLIISPNQIDSTTINPENLLTIKDKFNIKELLLIDNVKGVDGVVSISDHVNISGQNFLRASTPYGDLPQFPDMSQIYNSKNVYKKTVVHTVGCNRFKNATAKDKVLSESVGLVAPIVHYIGITVFAIGLSKPVAILEII